MDESKKCGTIPNSIGTSYWEYTYDGRGNLVSNDKYTRTTSGMAWQNEETYVYDETNHMVDAKNEQGEHSLYTYNGLGLRVGRELIMQDNTHGYTDFHDETPSVETGLNKPEVAVESYVIDYTSPTFRTLTMEEEGGFDYRWVYGLDKLSVKITSEGTNWWGQNVKQDILKDYLHQDRLGSTTNLSDKFGRVVGRADYNEWGEITYKDALDITSAYRRIYPQLNYTGHDWDDVLEMYYAKARFYDPDAKRFVEIDPVKGQVTDPLSLVSYLYCVDNPLRWVDPLGLVRNYLKINDNVVYLTDTNRFSSGSVQLREFINLLNDNGVSASVYYLQRLNEAFGTINGVSYRILFNQLSGAGGTKQGVVSTNTSNPGYFSVILCLDNATTYISLSSAIQAFGLENKVSWATDTEIALSYMEEVTEYAREYFPNPSDTTINSAVAIYLRQFNPNYISQTWDSTGGKIDKGFIDFVQQKNEHIGEFFSSEFEFKDNSNNEVDLLHLAATLSAYYYESNWDSGTGFTNKVKFQFMPEKHLDRLAGWVGDLHTLMLDVFAPYNLNKTQPDYKQTYEDTLNKLGNSKYSFSMDDLRADVDAVNIVHKKGVWTETARTYYSGNTDNRYSDFIKNETGKNPTKEVIAELANFYTGEDYYTFGWPLLHGQSVTGDQRRAFSDAFADFMMGLINDSQ